MTPSMTPKLLVSVRSAAEADEALAGGADLIDVKEPTYGSLGRAPDATVREIVERVARRMPTSAALGELRDWDGTIPDGVDFVKAGLAGLAGSGWRSRLDAFRATVGKRTVLAAYADWRAADAPPLREVIAYAEQITEPILLIDTHRKTGATLLDFFGEGALVECIARLRAVRGRIAVAGSLNAASAKRVATLGPDWLAVRGAVCAAGRATSIRAELVRRMRRAIDHSTVDDPLVVSRSMK